MVKNLPANAGNIRDKGSIPELGRSVKEVVAIPPVFLLGESHVQRSLAGVHGVAESDTTEAT